MDTHSEFLLPDQTCQRFTLAEIQLATNNFDKTLVVGRGGFGKVYRCKIGLETDVAIKRLHSTSNQGSREFEAEVKVLSKLRHGNLVSLIGYCNEGKEMALLYEFMPNGNLDDHLHKADTNMSWLQRLKICIGAARGLDYLHTGTSTQLGVIHRDVKSSNILLDANFSAKISDFGLAKVGPINQTRTFVSTGVKGTFGYMDPCYFFSGKLTRKSDVYAFGVVLFEVLTGRQAVDPTIDEDQWSLAAWAEDQIKNGKVNQIIDSRLMGQISKKCLKEFATIAVRCLCIQPKQRPSMAEVVVKLESILSQEREITEYVVDEGRFINRVRYFFRGKTEVMPARTSEISSDHIKKPNNQSSEISSDHIKKPNNQSRTFTYAELVIATNDFKHEEYSASLSECIYKGWVDEKTYAPAEWGVGLAMYVRKKDIGNSQLELKPEELDHPNLFKLLGYCLNEQQLLCVYELLPYTSLDKLLYGEPRIPSLSWVARLKIALGAAQGLSFLHQRNHPAYIQFKTANILVDSEYNARLSDYEVGKSFVALDSYPFRADAFYAAPEWFNYQVVKLEGYNTGAFEHEDGFGVKSEIYSFGVVLLELLTGMKVFDDNRPDGKQNLVKWATPLLADEVNLGMIVDPQLQLNNCPPKGAIELTLLVSKCLQPTQEKRPSMEGIFQVLYLCYQEETNQFENDYSPTDFQLND